MRAEWAKYEEAAGDHTGPGESADPAADGDEPATHDGADRVAGVAVDQQLTAPHPAAATRIGRTGVIGRRTMNVDCAAPHFGARPIVDAAPNLDRAARHAGADVSAGIA